MVLVLVLSLLDEGDDDGVGFGSGGAGFAGFVRAGSCGVAGLMVVLELILLLVAAVLLVVAVWMALMVAVWMVLMVAVWMMVVVAVWMALMAMVLLSPFLSWWWCYNSGGDVGFVLAALRPCFFQLFSSYQTLSSPVPFRATFIQYNQMSSRLLAIIQYFVYESIMFSPYYVIVWFCPTAWNYDTKKCTTTVV